MKHTAVLAVLLIAACCAWAAGEAALHVAIRSGDVETARTLLRHGADPNAPGAQGQRPLIEAVKQGEPETLRLLLAAGADPNLGDRGLGSALEIAEHDQRTEMAAMLRAAGAQGSGKSIGDKVCVRPWKGEGYCGLVDAIAGAEYRIRITNLVGCAEGCAARTDCSNGKIVGGADGLKAGDALTAPVACLTHTGVAR